MSSLEVVPQVLVSPWLTATEAAQYLKVKTRTLLMWVRAGKVKAFALSGTQRRIWRFKQSDLDAAVLEPVVYSFPLTVPKKRRVK